MNAKYPSRHDLVTAMRNRSCYVADELKEGALLQKNRHDFYSGGYSTVFPFQKQNGDKIAVRCWIADIYQAEERLSAIANTLKHIGSKYFVNFKYINGAIIVKSELQPIVVMDWVDGSTLLDFVDDNIDDPVELLLLAEKFKTMVEFFHANNISHGDLQHGNILVKKSSDVVVIDYDSMYVEDLNGFPDIIKGKDEYQHPGRKNNRLLNLRLDYFSELVIYLSLLALAKDSSLWKPGTDLLLFSVEDLQRPEKSEALRKLRKSDDKKVSYLSNKLIEFLKLDNLEDLLPLESVLNQYIEKQFPTVISDITSKF